MTILDRASLVKTLDNINDRFLLGQEITPEESREASRWIASRQGEKGSYRGLFAPTPVDFEQGIRLFTGEKLMCASARHIMGQEAARAAWLLGRNDAVVRDAYEKATIWMQDQPEFHQTGMFCCGRCTLSFWRNFQVGNFRDQAEFIKKGIQKMQGYRLGGGRWRLFPFFYAVYTLMDLDLDQAISELEYARPSIERYLNKTYSDPLGQRKATILKKALEKIN